MCQLETTTIIMDAELQESTIKLIQTLGQWEARAIVVNNFKPYDN